MDFSELAVGDMGVNLGGGDAWMAKHDLDRTQISSIFQKIGGETMAQNVGRYFFRYAGFDGVVMNDSFDWTRG